MSYLGPIPILVFILAVPCLVCVVTWLLTKSWILNNVLAFSLIIFFLTSVRLSSLKVYKFTEVHHIKPLLRKYSRALTFEILC